MSVATVQRNRTLTLRATGFPDLSLDSQEFASLQGTRGFAAPPRDVRWFDGAGHGSTPRSVRIKRRPLTLPVLVQAPNADVLEDRLNALASRFDVEQSGLEVRLLLDEGQERGQWYLDATYVDGLDITYGTNTNGSSWAQPVLLFECGQPFWTRLVPESVPIVAAGAGRGLLKGNVSLTALRQASGQTLGTVTFSNPGNARSYPVTTIHGPATGATLTAGPLTIQWAGNLLVGQRRIFDHKAGTVVDGNGVNRYDETLGAPKFWAVPPGTSQATVQLTGDTPGVSRVTIDYLPRKWLVV